MPNTVATLTAKQLSEVLLALRNTIDGLRNKLTTISQKTKLAEAIRYALSRWAGLTLFLQETAASSSTITSSRTQSRRWNSPARTA